LNIKPNLLVVEAELSKEPLAQGLLVDDVVVCLARQALLELHNLMDQG
jgi:hypothetical protein